VLKCSMARCSRAARVKGEVGFDSAHTRNNS
jgi:hypothetical protein